jgi:hypothetical protein
MREPPEGKMLDNQEVEIQSKRGEKKSYSEKCAGYRRSEGTSPGENRDDHGRKRKCQKYDGNQSYNCGNSLMQLPQKVKKTAKEKEQSQLEKGREDT